MAKFYRNWFVVSVLLLVLSYLWHVVIFASSYTVHLSGIARYVDGVPTPLFPYFILAHLIAGMGFVMFVPAITKEKGNYWVNGASMGVVTFGMFAVLAHALFAGWGGWLMSMDVAFGIISGAITGGILKKLS